MAHFVNLKNQIIMLIRYQFNPDFGTNFQFVTENFVKSILYDEEEDCMLPIKGKPTSGTVAEYTEGFDLFIQVIDLNNFSFNVNYGSFSIEGGHVIGGDPDYYHFNTD